MFYSIWNFVFSSLYLKEKKLKEYKIQRKKNTGAGCSDDGDVDDDDDDDDDDVVDIG